MKKSFIKGLALSICALLLTGCAKDPVHEVIIKLAGVSLEETSSEVSAYEDMIKKCLEGYAEYLKAHTELWQYETVYSLDYVNNDDIPDLIFGDTIANHASNIYILSYLDGNYDQVICCGPFGSYGATCYYPRLGIMYTSDVGMGYDSEYYSLLSSEKEYGFKTLCHRYFYTEEDYEDEPSESKFFIGEDEEKEITQEEYDKYVNELVEGTEYKVFSTYNNNNGYEYLNQEALDNSFNW